MLGENLMEGVWFWKAPIGVGVRYTGDPFLATTCTEINIIWNYSNLTAQIKEGEGGIPMALGY